MSESTHKFRTRLHAALVHFPISAWTGAAAIQLTTLFSDQQEWLGVDLVAAAGALAWIGTAFGMVAAGAGLVELSRLPAGDVLGSTAARHVLAMSTALAFFLVFGLAHPLSGALSLPAPALALLAALGLIVLCIGGHLGGRLVVLAEQAMLRSE